MSDQTRFNHARSPAMTIFLCGDVMLGRGVDQVLPQPCPPNLYEEAMDSALGYLALAERANGPIPRPMDFTSLWGAALEEWNRIQPHARVINLETSVTRSEDYEPKGINYRMSPENAGCLTTAGIDCCVLANNHVLDWGRAGLADTLTTLARLDIRTAGAGRNREEAAAPTILEVAGVGRLAVFAFGSPTSGVPAAWAATVDASGVNLLQALSEAAVEDIAAQVARIRRPGDVIVASIHWGPNWGYEVSGRQRWFAHALIDRAGVSIVHGHSSHHAKGIEVYNNRLILYGCGDFLNDYEGIGGYKEYRDDLAVMYFPSVNPASGELLSLEMVPLQIRGFHLVRPQPADVAWLQLVLDRKSRQLGAGVARASDGWLALTWPRAAPDRR